MKISNNERFFSEIPNDLFHSILRVHSNNTFQSDAGCTANKCTHQPLVWVEKRVNTQRIHRKKATMTQIPQDNSMFR